MELIINSIEKNIFIHFFFAFGETSCYLHLLWCTFLCCDMITVHLCIRNFGFVISFCRLVEEHSCSISWKVIAINFYTFCLFVRSQIHVWYIFTSRCIPLFVKDNTRFTDTIWVAIAKCHYKRIFLVER